MTIYAMALVSDAGGVPLRDLRGNSIGDTFRVALRGDCIVSGRSGGIDIINDPGGCDLNKGDEIQIKLDQNGILKGASFAASPQAGDHPAFCIDRSQSDKTCKNDDYIKQIKLVDKADLTKIQFKMKNVPKHSIETDIYYSMNFSVPGKGIVVVDPKIINKPRDEAFFLSLTTIILIALIVLPLTFFSGRAIGRRRLR